MAGSVRKESDQQTWGPEFESLEPGCKCWVQWYMLVTPVQRRWNRLDRLATASHGSPRWAYKHVLAFLCEIWAANSGHGCVASSISWALCPALNSVAEALSIMIREICLLLKYNTMKISIFHVSMNLGLWLFNQPSLAVGSLLSGYLHSLARILAAAGSFSALG